MSNWLLEHVTLPYIITLILGMLLGVGLGCLVDWNRRRRGKPVTRQSPIVAVASVVIILTMVWIMVSVSQARNCAITLNVAVAREQVVAKIERDAFAKAITDSQRVPSDIQALPQNDPRRKAYMDPILAEYTAKTSQANKMREANKEAQDAAQKACGTT